MITILFLNVENRILKFCHFSFAIMTEPENLDSNNTLEIIRQKHPDHVPIFVSKDTRCKDLPDISNKKFFVPKTLSIGNFVYCVRKRLEISEQQAIFLFVGNALPNPNESMGSLYEIHKTEDGILHCTYSSDTAYGN